MGLAFAFCVRWDEVMFCGEMGLCCAWVTSVCRAWWKLFEGPGVFEGVCARWKLGGLGVSMNVNEARVIRYQDLEMRRWSCYAEADMQR